MLNNMVYTGSPRQEIKITFPEDVPLAEFYLSRREGTV